MPTPEQNQPKHPLDPSSLPARFDPLDLDADPPRLPLTEEQVWCCETARHAFQWKLKHQPGVIRSEFDSLPVPT